MLVPPNMNVYIRNIYYTYIYIQYIIYNRDREAVARSSRSREVIC